MRRLGIGLTWIAAFFCAVFGVAAWRDDLHGWQRLIADFAPAGVVTCFVVALCAQALKGLGRGLSAALLFATLCWSGLVFPDVARASFGWPFGNRERVKLIQLNIQLDADRSAQKLAWLLKEDPDFITFQEVKDSRSPVVAALAKHYPYLNTNVFTNGPGQTVILSKQPAIQRGSADGGGKPETAWATFASPRGAFTLMSVHVSHGKSADQPYQFAFLAGLIHGFPAANSTVLAGDFNATPWSPELRRFDGSTNLARRTLDLATWPAFGRAPDWMSTAIVPIDQVYAGQDWHTRSVTRGPFLGSDHYPVVVVLTR